jgi:hypothetical protein
MTYFKVDSPVVVLFSCEVIFQDELFGNVSDFDVDVLGIYHWHVKVEFLMSMVKNHALLHGMTLLNMSLMSSNNAVLVPALPGLKIKFPLTVILVQFLSSLPSCISHTTFV